jgi:lipopolysaccharide transport system ATP-binding protein
MRIVTITLKPSFNFSQKSMNNTVIKVESLSKKYILSHQKQERYTALRDVISDKFRGMKKKIVSPFTFHRSHFADPTHEEFWALKDVSFEINQGDRVGIIGRNGAGKTTLLKILSRITEPTTGRVTIKGRVASLLEVGTGFHPELTGRENIFLNGAILGMSKAEIKKKFDEIVDFAEVEKFLDTPVKRYSSGMYVRLAFAVAAHLEPEILIVDEVLAVGDAQFQKKCLGKMEDVSAKEGRTVLFVSHNMGAISALCSKVVLLKQGRQKFLGSVEEGIHQYLAIADLTKGFANLGDKIDARQGPREFARLLSIETRDENDTTTGVVKMDSTLCVKIEFELFKLVPDIEMTFYFVGFGDAIYGVYSSRIEGFHAFKLGRQFIKVEIPHLALLPDNYRVGVWINSQCQPQDDLIMPALEIEVMPDNTLTGHYVDYVRYKRYGVLSRSIWKSA